MRVYPQPVELMIALEQSFPAAVFKAVMEMMTLEVSPNPPPSATPKSPAASDSASATPENPRVVVEKHRTRRSLAVANRVQVGRALRPRHPHRTSGIGSPNLIPLLRRLRFCRATSCDRKKEPIVHISNPSRQ